MGRRYSLDLRERVVAAVVAGTSRRQAARMFDVSATAASNWTKRVRETGSIDETWTRTNMAPLPGWAPRGKRLLGKATYGHRNTMTFIAALRHDRIDAPWLPDGPINRERFLLYVRKVLAPTLQPSEVVIADNLGSHK